MMYFWGELCFHAQHWCGPVLKHCLLFTRNGYHMMYEQRRATVRRWLFDGQLHGNVSTRECRRSWYLVRVHLWLSCTQAPSPWAKELSQCVESGLTFPPMNMPLTSATLETILGSPKLSAQNSYQIGSTEAVSWLASCILSEIFCSVFERGTCDQ